MCEYCNDDNMLGASKPGWNGVDAEIDGSDLVISGWYDTNVGISPLYIPIYFCPMCGRDLRGDAS
jgi:hypothetical protein